jgi:hypothetical protein
MKRNAPPAILGKAAALAPAAVLLLAAAPGCKPKDPRNEKLDDAARLVRMSMKFVDEEYAFRNDSVFVEAMVESVEIGRAHV